MARPWDAVCCTSIKSSCAGADCAAQAVAIASLPGPAGIDLIWVCDEHIEEVAATVSARGLDPQRHMFELSRTCRSSEQDGVPCGAAGDYLVVRDGGEAVMTVCTRHMEAWRPGGES
jgi:hypothetical protein